MSNSIILFFRGIGHGMKHFGASIVEIVNFILLLPVYLIGVGIPSMLAKISKKKFLNMTKSDKDVKSYWVDKDKKEQSLEDSYNQY